MAALHRRLAPAVLWITIEESGPAKGDEAAGAAGPSGQNDRDGSGNRGSTPLGRSVVLGVTPDHELLTADGRWQPAGLFKPGDALTGRAGWPVDIRDIQLDSTPQVVYNLTVDGPPTYLADGVWVHNSSCYRGSFQDVLRQQGRELPRGWQVHHRIPQRFRGLFSDAELHDVSNLAGVEPRMHAQITAMWEDFAQKNWNPSRTDVTRFQLTIDRLFGNHYILP
ncbi:MAG: hypothetical protein IPM64_13765 [Phycisphaerales bacterium]|nr:hypothetical protein [Phycisphaerales bacterium]